VHRSESAFVSAELHSTGVCEAVIAAMRAHSGARFSCVSIIPDLALDPFNQAALLAAGVREIVAQAMITSHTDFKKTFHRALAALDA
jgi:hypothetical protein